MACTACIVCPVSTVSGHCKNALEKGSASGRHTTNLSNLLFFRYLWIEHWPPDVNKIKCWYLNNCLHFLKHAALFVRNCQSLNFHLSSRRAPLKKFTKFIHWFCNTKWDHLINLVFFTIIKCFCNFIITKSLTPLHFSIIFCRFLFCSSLQSCFL